MKNALCLLIVVGVCIAGLAAYGIKFAALVALLLIVGSMWMAAAKRD